MSATCCICLEDVAVESRIGCKFHYYHSECFIRWHFIFQEKTIETAKCLICESSLNNIDENSAKIYVACFNQDLEEKLKRDDDDGIFDIILFKDDAKFYVDVVRKCAERGLVKTLKRLRTNGYGERNCILVTIKIIKEFFTSRNHWQVCWLVNDFDLDQCAEYSDSYIMEKLMNAKQYFQLKLVFDIFYERFSHEDLLAVLAFFYEEEKKGGSPYGERLSSPLEMIWILSPFQGEDKEKKFAKDLLPELIQLYYKHFAERDISWLIFFYNSAWIDTFWNSLKRAIITDDLEYFRFLWEIPTLNHKLTIPYVELAAVLVHCKNATFFIKFFSRHGVIKHPWRWRFTYSLAKLRLEIY